MNIQIAFGKQGLAIELPEGPRYHVVKVRSAPPLPDVEKALGTALDAPVAGLPLMELARGKKTAAAKTAPGKKENASATSGDVERLTQVLLKVLDASGYVKPRAAAATEENLRRMVRRMELNANDTDMWLGMLRQMAWKLGATEKDHE